LKERVKARATAVYAVPEDYPHAEAIADGFVDFFSQTDTSDWPNIKGPIWGDEERFAKNCDNRLAKHHSYDIIVNVDFMVVALWKT
jgi:hypothetical protein